MNVADEIGKLNKLKEEGALSEEEFQKAKTSLLSQTESTGEKFKKTVDDVATDTNMWGMFIHLSQFAGFMIPYAGLILPIVLWQIKKDESKVIDMHGRIVTNWIITATIFGVVFAILSAVFIGIPLLIGLAIVAVVFPIIGGIKANSGEVWAYPMSIKFFSLDDSTPQPAAPSTTPPQETPPAVPSTESSEKPVIREN